MSADTPLGSLAANEEWVWLAAIVFYGIGDTVTTLWGLSTGGVAEGGLLASELIGRYGYPGLLGIKVVTFAVFLVAWSRLRTPGRVAVPFALATVGVAVTAWNLFTIATAL